MHKSSLVIISDVVKTKASTLKATASTLKAKAIGPEAKAFKHKVRAEMMFWQDR